MVSMLQVSGFKIHVDVCGGQSLFEVKLRIIWSSSIFILPILVCFFINLPAAPCKQEPPFFMQKNWESIRYKVDDDDDIDYDEHEDKYSGMSWELLKKVKEVMEEEMGVEFNYE